MIEHFILKFVKLDDSSALMAYVAISICVFDYSTITFIISSMSTRLDQFFNDTNPEHILVICELSFVATINLFCDVVLLCIFWSVKKHHVIPFGAICLQIFYVSVIVRTFITSTSLAQAYIRSYFQEMPVLCSSMGITVATWVEVILAHSFFRKYRKEECSYNMEAIQEDVGTSNRVLCCFSSAVAAQCILKGIEKQLSYILDSCSHT